MNEVLTGSTDRLSVAGSIVKNLAWSLASQVGFHGLCPWELDHRWLLISRQRMYLPGLGEGFEAAKVVHLSDLHMSPFMLERNMVRKLEIVNSFEPDFVVLTGDFITTSARHYAKRLGHMLRRLRPKVASLAVLGNHDYGVWHPQGTVESRGLAQYVAGCLASAGIEPLVNASRTYRRDGASLSFVGVGELWSSAYDPVGAFESVSGDGPIVALVHNPDATNDLVACGARYVLAGHTHGHVVHETWVNDMLFPVTHRQFIAGQYYLGDDRHVYVNRGIGNSRRRRRNERPEIAVFSLTRTRPAPAESGSPFRAETAAPSTSRREPTGRPEYQYSLGGPLHSSGAALKGNS